MPGTILGFLHVLTLNPLWQSYAVDTIIISLLPGEGNWGSSQQRSWGTWPSKVTQLATGRDEIWTQAVWLADPKLWPQCYTAYKMLGRRDVIENCRVRASENSLLHKSHKKTGTVVRIDFFRTLETSQRLAAIWEVYVQEKWLNLNKNSKFYGVLSCLIPIFFFSCTVALKINSLGTSLVVQWLRLPMQGVWVRSLVGELGSHMPRGQKNQNIKQKQCCNTFNKDFKNGPHPKK